MANATQSPAATASHLQKVGAEIAGRSAVGERIRSSGRLTADDAPRRAKARGKEPLPLRISTHDYALINVAHRAGHPTRSAEAAFRVVEMVPDARAAAAVAARHPEGQELEFLLHPAHAWKLVSAADPPPDDAAVLARIQRIYDDNVASNRTRREKFDRYCEDTKRVSQPGAGADRAAHDADQRDVLGRARERMSQGGGAAAQGAGVENAPPPTASTSTLPAAYYSHGQRFAVVGIIEDRENDGDYIISVFAAFADLADAKRYAQDTLADAYDDFDVACVDTNQWVHPRLANHMDIERGYRHQLLHDVMQYKHREKARVAAHATQCAKMGKEMRVTTVTGQAEAVTPGPAVVYAATEGGSDCNGETGGGALPPLPASRPDPLPTVGSVGDRK